jgi:hypothetical protein
MAQTALRGLDPLQGMSQQRLQHICALLHEKHFPQARRAGASSSCHKTRAAGRDRVCARPTTDEMRMTLDRALCWWRRARRPQTGILSALGSCGCVRRLSRTVGRYILARAHTHKRYDMSGRTY